MKGLMEEQYPLDRRSPIQYPPDVRGKEIILKATLSKADEELIGVIAAQGNNNYGYSLFIRDNALIWLVRQGGETFRIKSPGNLPTGQFTVQATLMAEGNMSLEIDGKTIGTGKAPSLFSSPLNPAKVRGGNDNEKENRVGDYSENFR